MTEDVPPRPPRSLPTYVASAALACLSALLAFQILGSPRAALGALVAGGLVAHLAWPVLAMRPTGPSMGGGAATGALTLASAYVGAGLVGGGGSRVIVDHDAAIMLLFTFWIVVPVMVAAGVGLALLARGLASRGE